MAIKQIFFDMADTLLYKPDVLKVIQKILVENGFQVKSESILRAHRIVRELIPAPPETGREFYLNFNARLLETIGILPAVDLCEQIYLQCRSLPWTTYDDVSTIYEINLNIGVISNCDSTLTERLKKHFHADFHPVIISAECGKSKPDLGIYLDAIEKSGFAPNEIIHVGDSIRLDIVPAMAVGVRPILLDRAGIYEYYNGEKITGLRQLLNLLNEDKVTS